MQIHRWMLLFHSGNKLHYEVIYSNYKQLTNHMFSYIFLLLVRNANFCISSVLGHQRWCVHRIYTAFPWCFVTDSQHTGSIVEYTVYGRTLCMIFEKLVSNPFFSVCSLIKVLSWLAFDFDQCCWNKVHRKGKSTQSYFRLAGCYVT